MAAMLAWVTWRDAATWAADTGAKIVGVAVVVLVLNSLIRHGVPRAVRGAVLRGAGPRTQPDLTKRADTLGIVLVRTAQFTLLAVAALLVLAEVGYDIAPLLTGLGIGGIALGLGAQSLVRDTITGMFILIENQYGIGDLVSIAGVQGWVEDINLRRTVLRDLDGTLYSIPNGEVKVAGNLTRGYSGINLLVPLVTTADLDTAIDLIDRAGADLMADPTLGPLVVEAPRAVRVEGLTDKGVTLRVLGKAAPGSQFEVAGALRRRIKRAFDGAGLRFADAAPAPVPVPAPAPTPGSRP